MKFLRDSFRDFLTISGFFLRLRDFCGIFTGFKLKALVGGFNDTFNVALIERINTEPDANN